jgi:NOL1/NOP2/sun family putative RNA methylase
VKQEFHPDFITRYEALFSEKEFSDFLVSCETPLRKAIRINTLKISEDDFLKRSQKNNWQLTKIPYVDQGYFIDRDDTSIPLWKSIEYFAGLFYIQETSSMIPPMLLKNIDTEWIILDVSAAPGSKTTQIANYKKTSWLVIWNDIVAQRLKALKTNINYQGFYNCASSKLDWRDFGRYFKETFDWILLDAPCSGEGTMRKSEVRWSLEIIHDLARLQKKLILSAIEALKVWGTLVYSTCTMTPEEDEAVLSYAKDQLWDTIEIVPWTVPWLNSTSWMINWQWEEYNKEVEHSQKIWPHENDTEGFFIAKIIKNSSTNIYESLPYYQAKNDEVILKGKELKALYSQITKRYNIDKNLFIENHIIKKWTELEMRTKQAKQFSNYAMIQNMGIPFWSIIDNVFSFSFYAAQVFWKKATKNYIELQTSLEAEGFRIWKDLKLTQNQCIDSSPWQVIVKYDNIILWTSLLKKDLTLKNQVPRETIKI